jgi:hypothetical protein
MPAMGRAGRQAIVMALGPAVFDRHIPLSTKPTSLRPWRNAATLGAYPPGVSLLRNPITGIAACCARAASGQAAAAPPSSVMKSRRFMFAHSITSSARASSKGGTFEAERPPARVCPSDQLGAKNLCQIRWAQLFLLSTAYSRARQKKYPAAGDNFCPFVS